MTARRPEQLSLAGVPLHGTPTPLSRATTMRRSRYYVEAPSPKPWQCTVLAVDTAARSGWALSRCGKHLDSGEVQTLDAGTLTQIVANAVERAGGTPTVLVLEAPWGGAPDIVAGLGVARERWQRAWREHGLSPKRVLRVTPSTWRAAVLGSRWVSAPRAAVREREQLVARALVGYPVGGDEAPAILIARWAAHAARVGAVIGKRARRESLRVWLKGG